jgi:glycosyltransferase involved in cell wall biosynthesis
VLSIVIPVWSGTPLLIDMHIKLCNQVHHMCDELIVCEDASPYGTNIEKYCDKYIIHDERLGHAKNLQLGIDAAKGDFIGVLDSDVIIKSGSLRDLCNPGMFTEARCINQDTSNPDVFYIWCSVAPKELYEKFPLPTTGEILDEWARTIPKELIFGSFLVTYEHQIGIGYTEWKKVHG